jgi:F-box/leucine-rich repeat protein 2/20
MYISKFHNLRYLCLRNCPLQYDVSIWNTECPLIEELNVSGDSWVSRPFVLGIA